MFRRTWQSRAVTRCWHSQGSRATQSALLWIGCLAGSFGFVFHRGIEHKLQRLLPCTKRNCIYIVKCRLCAISLAHFTGESKTESLTCWRAFRVSGIIQRRRRALKQPAPSRDIYVHLIRSREVFHLLLEDLALTLQFWFSRYHRIQEFYLSEQQSLRLQL